MAIIKDDADGRNKLKEDIAKLEAVDTSVKAPVLPTVTLEQIKYEAPTDAELRNAAVSGLAEYKQQSEDSIRSGSAADEKALRDRRDALSADMKGEMDALDGSYRAAAQNIDNDVIKRGLARSSVAVNSKSALEKEYMQRSADIRESYGREISGIDAEISTVGAKLQKALDDFNIAYAAKLNEKLNTLKAERDKKVAEVVKYNNSVRSEQAKLDADKLKTESSLYAQALDSKKKANDLKLLSDKERDAIYKAVYARMDSYLSSLSPEQAKLEINNHTLYQQHLSGYYYYKLYDKYGR